MKCLLALLLGCTAILFSASAASAAIEGEYSDGQLTVALAPSGGALAGTFSLSNHQYPATATANGNSLEGTFKAGSDSFAFTATLEGDTLTLISGNKTYTLKRVSAGGNPLAGAAPVGGLPDGYTVVTTTDFGKALFVEKPQAKSVTAALESALPDLAHMFDAKPTVKGAYEDSKTHQSGGAIFLGQLKGQAIKGVVSCKLLDKSVAVSVIYCRADAPPAEWAKLTAKPDPAQPPAAGDGDKAPVNLLDEHAEVYSFPDGTGSITLAAGWKTQAQSAISPISVKGPADQNIFINSVMNVLTHNSPMVKIVQQNQQRMKQMGGNPPPPPLMLVAEFTDPVQAMKDLMPQMSKMNLANGGPATHLDEIVSQQDTPSDLPNGKAAIVSWKVTRTLEGKSTQYLGSQKVQMVPISDGSTWMYMATGFTTPVDAFEHDKPVIFAMINSVKVNPEMAAQRMRENNQQQNAMLKQQADASSAALRANADQFQRDQDRRFADSQNRLAQQKAGYDQHNQQFKADQLQKSRNKDDQVEHILGYRTVYDTQTGLSTTADLSNVTGVVNSLNEAALDPNRFVQIPLRDEQDPTPTNGH